MSTYQILPETEEEKSAREVRWKAFGELIQEMPFASPSLGIINASTKPGYDPMNSLAGFFTTPNPRVF